MRIGFSENRIHGRVKPDHKLLGPMLWYQLSPLSVPRADDLLASRTLNTSRQSWEFKRR